MGQDQEDFGEDLESLGSGWGTWTTLVAPGHADVCLYQQAKWAEPLFPHGRPGGEGACTSPAELAQPGPTIIHLH